MLLKRIYEHSSGSPVLDYIALAHTGVDDAQNFSIGLITAGIDEGWASINGDALILHVSPEELVYTIKRKPGHYCLHCGEKLESDEKGSLAHLHVAMNHKGQASPDPNNPAGYERINHFECVLNADQHEKYKLKRTDRAPVFHVREG